MPEVSLRERYERTLWEMKRAAMDLRTATRDYAATDRALMLKELRDDLDHATREYEKIKREMNRSSV